MEIKVLCLYPNIMDLYGDNGNLEILKYRLSSRNIDMILDSYTIGDSFPDLSKYDLVFMGGGSDKEQKLVAGDLIAYKDKIKKSIKSGTFYLLICGAYQLFGAYYKDSEDNLINGLNIFDYYTLSSTNKKERCIGNVVVESDIFDEPVKIVGFENHGGQTYNVDKPFAKVLYGNGNTFKSGYEGYFYKNVLGTYLHGPLLSKNPELADYILKYVLKRKYKEDIELNKLDDEFENIAKKEMLDKLLNSNI